MLCQHLNSETYDGLVLPIGYKKDIDCHVIFDVRYTC